MERDDDSIWMEATINDDGLPSVLVQFEGYDEIRTVASARAFAIALFGAAAIAESEAAMYFGMMGLEKPRGFGKSQRRSVSMDALQLVHL